MIEFRSKLYDLRKEAIAYIESIIAIRGTGYELCPPQEDEDEPWEELNEMPCHKDRDKHNVVTLFYIHVLTVPNPNATFEKVIFEGYNPDAAYKEHADKAFYVDELDTETLCYMADLIYSLENPVPEKEFLYSWKDKVTGKHAEELTLEYFNDPVRAEDESNEGAELVEWAMDANIGDTWENDDDYYIRTH